MRLEKLEETVTLPEGVTATVETSKITVKGPKGELSRRLLHPQIKVTVTGNTVVFNTLKPSKREKRQLFTYVAHLKNMGEGVTEGFRYVLKVCSGHFPMTVTFKDHVFEVKNFFGETVPRRQKVSPDVDLKIDGQLIVLEGTDKEKVGNVASSLEKLTTRTGFDKRVFQDGIYIIEKAGKKYEA